MTLHVGDIVLVADWMPFYGGRRGKVAEVVPAENGLPNVYYRITEWLDDGDNRAALFISRVLRKVYVC